MGRLLGVAYAAGFAVQIDPLELLRVCLFLVFVLSIGAAYTSVINDFYDLEDDTKCGKANNFQGRSRAFCRGALALSWLAGLGVMSSFRSWPGFLALYGCAWMTFTAYSAPPLRLKSRGGWGVLADAVGSELLPAWMAVVAVSEVAGRSPALSWTVCLLLWSLMWGLRGITAHQFQDSKNDLASGLQTWVSLGPQAVKRAVESRCFPFEVVSLTSVLGALNCGLNGVFLAAYVCLELTRFRRSGGSYHLVVVKPRGTRWRLVLHDFYLCFFPISFLCGLVLQSRAALVLLALHLVCFPNHALRSFLSGLVK